MGEKCVLINLREFGKIIMTCSLCVYKNTAVLVFLESEKQLALIRPIKYYEH